MSITKGGTYLHFYKGRDRHTREIGLGIDDEYLLRQGLFMFAHEGECISYFFPNIDYDNFPTQQERRRMLKEYLVTHRESLLQIPPE